MSTATPTSDPSSSAPLASASPAQPVNVNPSHLPPESSPNGIEVNSSGSVDGTSTFANGLYHALHPAVLACDQQVKQVLDAQSTIASHIDRLNQTLIAFRDASRMPALTPYTEKLQSSRKRIKKIHSNVDKIQQRLEEIRALVRKKELQSSASTSIFSKPRAASTVKPNPTTTTTTTTTTTSTTAPATTVAGTSAEPNVSTSSSTDSSAASSSSSSTSEASSTSTSTSTSDSTSSASSSDSAPSSSSSSSSSSSTSAAATEASKRAIAELLNWD